MTEPEAPQPEGAPEWMVTFADLMSLLLTFFVLLLSFSNMEVVKFRTMAGAVRNALGLKSEFDLSDIPMGHTILPYHNPKEGEGGKGESEAIRGELDQMLRDSGIPEKGRVEITEHGIALEIDGDVLFDSGSAELKPESLPMLARLADYLPRVRHNLDILGHTDNLPIATTVYPSNWELSAARAGRAVRFLVEHGLDPQRLRAIGLAATVPLAPNDTVAGRATNRRIEFLFRTPPTTIPSTTIDEPEENTNQDE